MFIGSSLTNVLWPSPPQGGCDSEVSSLREKVDSLEGELTAKDEEMKELLKAVESLQSKVQS